MEPLEPDITPLPASFPIVPATNPEGGWGARRTPLPAPPLGLDPAQRDGDLDPLALRTFVVSTLSPQDRRVLRERLTPEERARLAAETAGPEGERLLMVRAGLRLLVGQMLDADPGPSSSMTARVRTAAGPMTSPPAFRPAADCTMPLSGEAISSCTQSVASPSDSDSACPTDPAARHG
jgi:hypothetical protein